MDLKNIVLKMQNEIIEIQEKLEKVGTKPTRSSTVDQGGIETRVKTLEKTVSKMYTLITSGEDAKLPYERVDILEPKPKKRKEGKRRWLIDEDIQYIKDNYGKMKPKDMAEHLKVTSSTVYNRIRLLKATGRIPSDVVEGGGNKFHPYAVRHGVTLHKEGVIKILQLPKGFNSKAAANVLRGLYPKPSEASIMKYASIYTKELRERGLLVGQKLPDKQGMVMSPKDIHVIKSFIEKLQEECED